jgi:hypothetical protein
VAGTSEHGNEPSGYIKCWEILELLTDWRLRRKGSAPRSLLVFVSILQDVMYVYIEYTRKRRKIHMKIW